MTIFKIIVRHDNGKTGMQVISYSGMIQEAIDKLCQAEDCPETAIISIRRMKTTSV